MILVLPLDFDALRRYCLVLFGKLGHHLHRFKLKFVIYIDIVEDFDGSSVPKMTKSSKRYCVSFHRLSLALHMVMIYLFISLKDVNDNMGESSFINHVGCSFNI